MSNFKNKELFSTGRGRGHTLIKNGKSPISTVDCIPTQIKFGIPLNSGSGSVVIGKPPALGVLTFSINDGPKVTRELESEFSLIELIAPDLYDGHPFFIDLMFGIEPDVGDDGILYFNFSGLGTDGATFDGVNYDPQDGFKDFTEFDSAPVTPDDIIPESNVIKFYPTPEKPRDTDIFYFIMGDTTVPHIALHSCYKAVKEEPVIQPGTCVPVDGLLTEYRREDIPQPDFSVGAHARYRINGGEWVDYVMDMNAEYVPTHYSDVWKVFSGTITMPTVLPNGVTMDVGIIAGGGGDILVEIPDATGEGWVYFNVPTPFWDADYGYNNPVRLQSSRSTTDPSLSNPEPWDYPEEVVEDVVTTLEFVTSQGIGADLVEAFFGGDVTVKACGKAVWPGL